MQGAEKGQRRDFRHLAGHWAGTNRETEREEGREREMERVMNREGGELKSWIYRLTAGSEGRGRGEIIIPMHSSLEKRQQAEN